ncbi:unnamed protein product [Prorocentrum cordatum]|uniref:Uncharacterized protein n=1 Tax=Prorocentrum cordatum TaxID=2364126 RepID=A0ABN9TYM5_9DINO|nr:unnamed protein product [Polarella glacialis]
MRPTIFRDLVACIVCLLVCLFIFSVCLLLVLILLTCLLGALLLTTLWFSIMLVLPFTLSLLMDSLIVPLPLEMPIGLVASQFGVSATDRTLELTLRFDESTGTAYAQNCVEYWSIFKCCRAAGLQRLLGHAPEQPETPRGHDQRSEQAGKPPRSAGAALAPKAGGAQKPQQRPAVRAAPRRSHGRPPDVCLQCSPPAAGARGPRAPGAGRRRGRGARPRRPPRRGRRAGRPAGSSGRRGRELRGLCWERVPRGLRRGCRANKASARPPGQPQGVPRRGPGLLALPRCAPPAPMAPARQDDCAGALGPPPCAAFALEPECSPVCDALVPVHECLVEVSANSTHDCHAKILGVTSTAEFPPGDCPYR